MSTLRKIVTALSVVCVVGGMMTVIALTTAKDKRRMAEAVDIIVRDSIERQFVTEGELRHYLVTTGAYPRRETVNTVALQRMEQMLRSHPMIRRAECYATAEGRVRAVVSQRVPLLRVETPTEHYFVDTDRRIMPAWERVNTAVWTARGDISRQLAENELADLAVWLDGERRWRESVERLEVNNRDEVTLRMTDGLMVRLGRTDDYRLKMAKLALFLDNPFPDVPEYGEVDLRYRGQVVARKKR